MGNPDKSIVWKTTKFKWRKDRVKYHEKEQYRGDFCHGTVGGLLLAIGMCMCLLPEWNAFVPGVVLAVIGAITLLAIWPVSRKASGKAFVHITGGYVAATLLGLIGAVALGIGLVNCLQTVTVFGLAVGIVGLIFILAAVLVGRRAARPRLRSPLTGSWCWPMSLESRAR